MWTVRYPLVRGCQVIRRVGSYFRSVHAGSRIIHDASAAIGAAGVAVALLAAHTPAASPLEIDGRRAATGVFLAPGADPDNADLAGSPMLAELVGIAGELDARDLARLGSASGNPLTIPDHGARAGTLVLARGATVARRPIVALDDGRLAIVDPTDPARGAPIRLDMLARLGIDTTRLSPTDPVPLREALAGDRWIGPTRPSPIQLRGVTHRVRLGRAVAPLTKTLDPPEIRVRLPRDHDPDDPTGVLVWVSDTASGALPAQLERPCDRLGLVAIGVDHAGDDAPRADRIQRVLDALASVRTIARIDPDRVYIAGFSGGAAIASMAQLALPELFRGALAISGLASHHDAPTGEPGLAWDADLTEPTPERPGPARRAPDRGARGIGRSGPARDARPGPAAPSRWDRVPSRGHRRARTRDPERRGLRTHARLDRQAGARRRARAGRAGAGIARTRRTRVRAGPGVRSARAACARRGDGHRAVVRARVAGRRDARIPTRVSARILMGMPATQQDQRADRFRPFGTTIFSEMTALAQKHSAVNLGQGFPDFDGPAPGKDAAREALAHGWNQYAPLPGMPALREQIARWSSDMNGLDADPETEITVTTGCTEAIAATLMGLVNPGDEVVLFEPFYDSYRACVAMSGATARTVTIRPDADGMDSHSIPTSSAPCSTPARASCSSTPPTTRPGWFSRATNAR